MAGCALVYGLSGRHKLKRQMRVDSSESTADSFCFSSLFSCKFAVACNPLSFRADLCYRHLHLQHS